MPARYSIVLLTLAIGIVISWLLVNDMGSDQATAEPAKIVKKAIEGNSTQPKSDRNLSDRAAQDLLLALKAIPNERIVSFKTEEAYRDFLKKLGSSNVRNLGQIDGLRAVRLGFDNMDDFLALGLDPDDLNYNFPVTIPPRGEVDAQSGIVGFGTSALAYLGITGDNSTWGAGVKIAVIDTGIQAHLALSNNFLSINLVELAEGLSPHSHGTSVASLIAGQHPNMLGVAPQASLISIRVADESGNSNSFLLAQGIMEAVANGAQIINISMGSEMDSPIVYQAVKYAIEKGAVIFASSGNDGLPTSAYPGAYKEVISVGAVDANGQHLNFSSSLAGNSLSAPGLEIQAAYPGDQVTSFTGTSASAPLASGAVAAVMSQSSKPINAQEAVNILLATSNEAGAPGTDPAYGSGILNVGRAINRDTPGIVDVAVASQSYLLPVQGNSSSGLQVSVENRGTETVWNSVLNVNIAGGTYPVQITSLEPNERRVITIPAGLQQLESEGQLSVRSEIVVSSNTVDSQPANNSRSERVTLSNDSP